MTNSVSLFVPNTFEHMKRYEHTSEISLKHRAHEGTVDVEVKGKKQREGGEIAAGFMSQAIDKPFRDIFMQSVALNQD